MKMKFDAVFEGGGVRGIAFIGAICCLEEKNYQWQRVAGTSVGSVVAALLAAGYTGKEMMNIMIDTDFNQFMDAKGIQTVPLLGKALGLLLENGMYQGDYIEQWMRKHLEAKGKTKFKDVMLEGESRLKIIASDITRRKILIFPDDLTEYGIDPMEFEIAKAVRMSAGIPLYYIPQKLRYQSKVDNIVDGGILSNFPVWIFDVEGEPRWSTFGFNLIDPQAGSSPTGRNLLSYVFDIVEAVIDEDQSTFLRDKDSVRTIAVPTLGIRATDFNITYEESFQLYRSGYESCRKYLEQWDFKNYIRKYR